MTANNTWDVHILLVAFSRRICCSRVCSTILKAFFPLLSFETPMTLPGTCLIKSFLVAKKAACGPPYPIGTPNRCEFPRTISAPISPGGFKMAKLNKSEATHASALLS